MFFFIAVFAFRPIEYMPPDWKQWVAKSTPENHVMNWVDKEEWPPFFHMPVLMLMLITLLNDGTLIAIGYDNATPRATPEKWNLKVLFLMSTLLAGVSLLSSLLLLWWLLDSWNQKGVFMSFGLGGLSYGQVTTSVYLKVCPDPRSLHSTPLPLFPRLY